MLELLLVAYEVREETVETVVVVVVVEKAPLERPTSTFDGRSSEDHMVTKVAVDTMLLVRIKFVSTDLASLESSRRRSDVDCTALGALFLRSRDLARLAFSEVRGVM